MTKTSLLTLVSLSLFSLSTKANFLERIPVSEDEVEVCEMQMKVDLPMLAGKDNKNVRVRTLTMRPDAETAVIRVMIAPGNDKKGNMKSPGQTDEITTFNVSDQSTQHYTFMTKPTVKPKERKWADVHFHTEEDKSTGDDVTTGTVRLIRSQEKKFKKNVSDVSDPDQKAFVRKYWPSNHFDSEWNSEDFSQPWYDEYDAANPTVRDSNTGVDSTITADTSYLMSAYTYIFSYLRLVRSGDDAPKVFHIGKLINGPNVHLTNANFEELKNDRLKISGKTKIGEANTELTLVVDKSTDTFESFKMTATGKAGPISATATWTLVGEQTCKTKILN